MRCEHTETLVNNKSLIITSLLIKTKEKKTNQMCSGINKWHLILNCHQIFTLSFCLLQQILQ